MWLDGNIPHTRGSINGSGPQVVSVNTGQEGGMAGGDPLGKSRAAEGGCVTRGRGLRTAALVLRICRRPRDAAHSDSGETTGHPRFGGAKCGYGAGRAAESDTESMARHQHPESGT